MESDSMKTTSREEFAEIVTHAAFYCDGQRHGQYSVWQKKSGQKKISRRNVAVVV